MENKRRRSGVGITLVLAILTGPMPAQGAGETDQTAVSAPDSYGALDGKSFVGKIGPEDNQDLDDELHFADGRFWSTNCVACGYQPGVYLSRRVGDSIEFHGSLQSGDGGSFDYSGRVVGDQVDVQIRWTQQRWYGNAERKLAFVGVLAPAAPLDIAALPTGSGSDAKPQCRRL